MTFNKSKISAIILSTLSIAACNTNNEMAETSIDEKIKSHQPIENVTEISLGDNESDVIALTDIQTDSADIKVFYLKDEGIQLAETDISGKLKEEAIIIEDNVKTTTTSGAELKNITSIIDENEVKINTPKTPVANEVPAKAQAKDNTKKKIKNKLTYTASLSNGNKLPAWLKFDAENRRFSGKPENNDVGVVEVKVTATDEGGKQASSIFKIVINNVNDAPIASKDTFNTQEDNSLNLTAAVLNDIDPDNDKLEISRISGAKNGIIYKDKMGYSYKPNMDFNGNETLSYTVSDGKGGEAVGIIDIVIEPINDIPTANNDLVIVDEDNKLILNSIIDNDYDIDGDTISILSFTSPKHGNIERSGKTVSYIPTENFNGEDAFEYTISDGNGLTSSAKVYITINDINDAPAAKNDVFTTKEDTGINIASIIENDSDVDGDKFEITSISEPTHGEVTLIDGKYHYTPKANFNGVDEFNYVITDKGGLNTSAQIMVNVMPVNDAPNANPDSYEVMEDSMVIINNVLDNDGDIDMDKIAIESFTMPINGLLEYSSSIDSYKFVYKPNKDFFGLDKFTYTIKDAAGAKSVGTVTVNVGALNDNPTANNDIISTSEDQEIAFNVLSNDSDVDGDDLKVKEVSTPMHGKLSFIGNGEFVYLPDVDFNGRDAFSYSIEDGKGGYSMASVMVKVASVNDAPKNKISLSKQEVNQGGVFELTLPEDMFVDDQEGIDEEIDLDKLNNRLENIFQAIESSK